MTTAIVVQARMGSTRLPGKVLRPLSPGRTVLDWVIERVRRSRLAAQVILATTTVPADDELADYARQRGLALYRGAEEDVLARYVGAADHLRLSAVVRITADCPFIEPELIDAVIEKGWATGADYTSTEGYPRGIGDIEYVTTAALRRMDREAGDQVYYREHVTTFLLDHPERFHLEMLHAPASLNHPEVRLTVDEPADLDMVRSVFKHFAPRTDLQLDEILALLDANPEIAQLNAHVRQKSR